MTDPVVTVFNNKFAGSWPRNKEGKAGKIEPFGWAIDATYSTDAHMVAYESPNGRRLGREAIGELECIKMHTVIMDVDCPKELKTDGEAPQDWRDELLAKVQAMALEHPDPFYYETRGGARFVYKAPKPFEIRSDIDARRWSITYSVLVEYFKHRFDIEADPACIDWQRMYRLPDTIRDGVRQKWRTWGSPHVIGALRIEHVGAKVYALAKWTGKAFRAANKEIRDFVPVADADAAGVLVSLVKASGGLIRAQPGDGIGWFIRCPNEAQHSSGRTGDSSTVLYPAAVGEQWGSIHCKHTHCQGMQVKNWLDFFTQSQIDIAKEANGIKREYTQQAALVDLAEWKAGK